MKNPADMNNFELRDELIRRVMHLLRHHGTSRIGEFDEPGLYETRMELKLDQFELVDDSEIGMKVTLLLPGPTSWARAGRLVAFDCYPWEKGETPVIRTWEPNLVQQALLVFRKHMVLDDLADV